MATPVRPLDAPAASVLHPIGGSGRRGGALVLAPVLTLVLFLAPVAIGLAGTWLPAVGILPALGGDGLSLAPFLALFAEPGLTTAIRLSVVTGVGSTMLALVLAILALALASDGRTMRTVRRALAPLLAIPHAAFAVGLAFLLAPSGWLARLVSPGLTGWDRPPDLATVNDPAGMALLLGLTVKETPFLILMGLAALNQIPVRRTLAVGRSLGYGPAMAWMKTILPLLYPQMRLPVFAVLAYGLSTVDMALLLGPTTPPTLGPLLLDWFYDPDLRRRFVAAAGAVLQLFLMIGIAGLWRLGEIAVARAARPWLTDGRRGRRGGRRLAAAGGAGVAIVVTVSLLAFLMLALWSLSEGWRYPDAWPAGWTLDNWASTLPALGRPFATTALVALTATLIGLALVVGCLEFEDRSGFRPGRGALWLIYTPLLIPQLAFLFGIQVSLVTLRLDGTFLALVWTHLLFVLPYIYLTLAEPWRALDPRLARSAAALGRTPGRILWRVKLPVLLRPVLFAASVGFAVSVAQYLPTIFAGAGRLPTLTTEAVGLGVGGDRRVAGIYAFAQAALPLMTFALAMAVPAVLYRHRRNLRP